MATRTDEPDLWEVDVPRPADMLVVDVDGFEGPLDLLLDLARSQKVDLARISVLALAEQYLLFIERSRELKLELAGDYLVMAAWLAYLKSRLLLPTPSEDDEPSGEELAAALALRLKRLEAMRKAARHLVNRDRLGRDVFARGEPQLRIVRKGNYLASQYDLLTAYARLRRRNAQSVIRLAKRVVWSLVEAREVLARLIGKTAEWTPLTVFMSPYLAAKETRRTIVASSFGASLEMAREGQLELRQATTFGPLMIRSPAAKARPQGATNG
jgi:segregation and condensation protein A